MQKTTTYREQSRMFMTQAYEELEKGDLAQASEKGWGASAQMVKANAQKRGWDHFTHRDLIRAVDRLTEQTDDLGLATLFGSAGFLHVNFYENGFSARAIEATLRRVERFVEKAERLLHSAH